jgi:hypothetical protein
MNIYLVSQSKNNNYDTYDAFVCVANNAEDAAVMPPRKKILGYGLKDYWLKRGDPAIKVKFIGVASPEMKKGVVLASYNAG